MVYKKIICAVSLFGILSSAIPPSETKRFAVQDVQGLFFRGNGKLTINQGPEASVQLEGNPGDIAKTSVVVKEHVLDIRETKKWWNFFTHNPTNINCIITVLDLSTIVLEG